MPDNLLLPGETGTLQLFKYVWGEVGRCKLICNFNRLRVGGGRDVTWLL